MDSAELPTGSLNFHMCDFETTPVLCVKSEVMALIALAIWLGLPQSRKHPVELSITHNFRPHGSA